MDRRTIKRLVLFLDGTWNQDDESTPSTNVVRMREALKIGVDRAPRSEAGGDPSARGTMVGRHGGPDVEYVVFYDRGVGTGAWGDRLRGGATGDGLELNIRQAYRFLSQHYETGAEIFIFGFSRGSFTARSLVGYLFATGLLMARHCTAESEERAWRHYRTSPHDRSCGEWFVLQPLMHPREGLRIKCLGVFDTVGALGIPLEGLRRVNAQTFEFHNTELSSIVETSLHAVAIDEPRRAFEAALWEKPKFKQYPGITVEQVWFPGAHADIGGGYTRWTEGESGRQDIAFAWMMDRARVLAGLDLPDLVETGTPALAVRRDEAARATIHHPWGGLDWVRAPACRLINQIPPLPGHRCHVVGRKPHADALGEMVHVSALALLAGEGAKPSGYRSRPYRPPNLLAALPAIAATYGSPDDPVWAAWKPHARHARDGTLAEPELLVVGWDGWPIAAPSATSPRGGALTPCDVLAMLPPPAAVGIGV